MKRFEGLYRELDKQCSYYSRHLGHLKALINNPDWMRVVDGSMSGYALMLGNSEIANALVLFNTRMFDDGDDTKTILKLGSCVPREDELETHHLKRMAHIGVDGDLEPYFAARRQFVEASRELKKKDAVRKLVELKDHVLAHNIVPDRDFEKATYNDLIKLTLAVTKLVDLAGFLVESRQPAYPNLIERAERHTRMLYACLPRLEDVEIE